MQHAQILCWSLQKCQWTTLWYKVECTDTMLILYLLCFSHRQFHVRYQYMYTWANNNNFSPPLVQLGVYCTPNCTKGLESQAPNFHPLHLMKHWNTEHGASSCIIVFENMAKELGMMWQWCLAGDTDTLIQCKTANNFHYFP